jgi:hypothetical protein
MYNEIFVRSALAEMERQRDMPRHHADHADRFDKHPPNRPRTRRNSPSYLRGLPASEWRAALTRRPAAI